MTFMGGATRYLLTCGGSLARDGLRPDRPPPPSREGPRGRAVLRGARRRRPREGRRALPGALQPRVPPRLRGVAARLPAHPPARARRGAAPDHRPLGGRHLLLGRAVERRVVPHELPPGVWGVACGLPRDVPAGRPPRAGADVRAARLRPPATQHVSRRQRAGARLAWLSTV